MKKILRYGLLGVLVTGAFAQSDRQKYSGAIYKEKDVPAYTLPDVLTTFAGKKVRSVEQWESVRRPEIMDFFAENLYGKVPTPPDPIKKTSQVLKQNESCLEGLCTRKDIIMTFKNSKGSVDMPMILFVPNHIKGPVPAIYWMHITDVKDNRFDLDGPQGYGKTRNGAPLKQLMLRGIALASLDCGALGHRSKSRSRVLNGGIVDMFFKPGQKNTADDEWGLMTVWAYAMTSGMDYLVSDKDIKPDQIAVLGCSIGGKVALWAAAQDQRIGMVLSATSGHGGEALWRREFGETLANMCEWLPRWPCRNAQRYAHRVHEMPVDQHMLVACIAPRPLYVGTGLYDYWADQKGQWLGTYHASPVYKLYGKKLPFKSEKQPPVNQPIVKSAIGYHVRTGSHGLTLYDWERFLEFIEYHFMKIPIRSVHDIYHPNGKLLDHYPNKLRKSNIASRIGAKTQRNQ